MFTRLLLTCLLSISTLPLLFDVVGVVVGCVCCVSVFVHCVAGGVVVVAVVGDCCGDVGVVDGDVVVVISSVVVGCVASVVVVSGYVSDVSCVAVGGHLLLLLPLFILFMLR